MPALADYQAALARVVRDGLAEDVGPGDVTTLADSAVMDLISAGLGKGRGEEA